MYRLMTVAMVTLVWSGCGGKGKDGPVSSDTPAGAPAGTTTGGTTTGSTTTGTTSGGTTNPDCFHGVEPLAPIGSGTCAQPLRVDLSGQPPGTDFILQVGSLTGADEADFGTGGCNDTGLFDGTQRDVVISVTLPAGSTAFDVSVEAANGSDPKIGVFEDPSCLQPINACADGGATGGCEFLTADNPTHFFGTTTYVVVSENVASNADWIVSFRAH